jgi:putative oxidoreductase
MAAFMKPYVPQTYAAMRIIIGLLFMSHGLSKLLGWPTAVPAEAPPAILFSAGPIEAVGGGLIAVGLFTRWAAFLCCGEMAVAYWLAHGLKAWHPAANGGETAVLYCFVFLFIAAYGSGIWSADASRGRS